jgi:uncharacterized coiled-coil protein SlyX
MSLSISESYARLVASIEVISGAVERPGPYCNICQKQIGRALTYAEDYQAEVARLTASLLAQLADERSHRIQTERQVTHLESELAAASERRPACGGECAGLKTTIARLKHEAAAALMLKTTAAHYLEDVEAQVKTQAHTIRELSSALTNSHMQNADLIDRLTRSTCRIDR